MRRTPLRETHQATSLKCKPQFSQLQHGDNLFLTVVEPLLLDAEVLADEGLRDFCFCTVAEDFERSAPLLGSTFLLVQKLALVCLWP